MELCTFSKEVEIKGGVSGIGSFKSWHYQKGGGKGSDPCQDFLVDLI